jgi:peptidylprolyl isomerase
VRLKSRPTGPTAGAASFPAVPVVRLVLLLLALAVALAACGDDDEGDSGSGTTTEPQAQTTQAQPPTTPPGAGAKPEVEKPSGRPPKKLEKKDLVRGEGRAAKSGDAVRVHYVGVSFSTGEQFDASWDRGEPLDFELGAGMVIEGWDKGVVGMKPGGRRQLTIPPDLAYGAEGQPPAIGPNETLVFVIDLLEVR